MGDQVVVAFAEGEGVPAAGAIRQAVLREDAGEGEEAVAGHEMAVRLAADKAPFVRIGVFEAD